MTRSMHVCRELYSIQTAARELQCEHSGVCAAIEGTQGLPPAASGAFLPDRTRDPAYQGAQYPFLDNPGRVPGAHGISLYKTSTLVPGGLPTLMRATLFGFQSSSVADCPQGSMLMR